MISCFAWHDVVLAQSGDFIHGVASGDPTTASVIIWTRWTPAENNSDTSTVVYWRVSTLNDLSVNSAIVRRGAFTTTADRDWTVKITVSGLRSNTRYFYGFSTEDAESIVGMTRTVPSSSDGDVPLNLALFSCSNWRDGYFHAYSLAASADNLDLLLHVGDFIYEFGNYAFPSLNQGSREGVLPAHETISLADYRTRHALHRTDPGLRAVLSRAPMVAVWDDHDFVDNVDIKASVNHQTTCRDLSGRLPGDPDFTPFNCDQNEGDFATRLTYASRAFHEWLPIVDRGSLDSAADRVDITQTLEWGNLATLVAANDRLDVRTCVSNCGAEWTDTLIPSLAYLDTNRSHYDDPSSLLNQQVAALAAGIQAQVSNASNVLYAPESIDYLRTTFARSKSHQKPWQIFASQSVLSNQRLPDIVGGAALFPAQISGGVNQILEGVFLDNTAYPPAYPFAVNIPSSLLRASYVAQKHGVALTQDSWDGYTHQREQLLQIFAENTNNLVVLSGDSHNGFVFDLSLNDTPVGVEFNGPSVSSRGYETNTIPFWDLGLGAYGFQVWRAAWIVGNSPAMTYSNPVDRGFVLLHVTPDAMTAEYYYISSHGAPWNRAANDIHPIGSEELTNATFNGGYYCEAMVTLAGSHTSQPVDACVSQFGHGLDPLIGANNIFGSPASFLSFSSSLLFSIIFLFFIFF